MAAPVAAAPVTAQTVDTVRHELVIRAFRTEGGLVLPKTRLVYGTYGHSTPRVTTPYCCRRTMADLTGYGFLIGPGRALDPSKLFLVTTVMFGNGRTSSPSNTLGPLHGQRFPTITLRDDVAAIRAMLGALHVRHLRAVIG